MDNLSVEKYVELRKSNNNKLIAFLFYVDKGGKYTFDELEKHNIFKFINYNSLFEELDIKLGVTLTYYNHKLINIEKNAVRKEIRS